jgi:DNA polymerase-3 subunit gamma/tau
MTYQVLARKWRPRIFKDLVGQEHVKRALVNALDNDRLHHAYLFTGTRGVGKTTIARIFAKSLNCESGVSSEPCGQCSACTEIDEGRFVDLIEVDAASRTKVEETRDLLENVQYAPTRGRYKVYLIDEVHMFSNHSFNALLKTLEEPPPHVKFLLATTDPQKLPVTILSRCLQFNLKKLTKNLISDQLVKILGSENVAYDDQAVIALARASEGSMRDALSLLDQAIAYSGGSINIDDVNAMLGNMDHSMLLEVLHAIQAADAAQLMDLTRQIDASSPDYYQVAAELIGLIQKMAVISMVPGLAEDEENRDLAELSGKFSPDELQLYYQIALNGLRDLSIAPDPRSAFEMLLLRIVAFSPVDKSNLSRVTRAGGDDSTATVAADKPRAKTGQSWNEIVDALAISGLERELAMNCSLQAQDENNIVLAIPATCANLCSENAVSRLQQSLSDYYGRKLELKIQPTEEKVETPTLLKQQRQQEQQQAAEKAIQQDKVVKALQETFNADLDNLTITPAEQ